MGELEFGEKEHGNFPFLNLSSISSKKSRSATPTLPLSGGIVVNRAAT